MTELISVPTTVDVVRVEGPDALTYLQSQLSQDLRALAVGEAVASFVLEPTGKVDALMRVRRVGEEAFELDVEAGFGDVVLTRLQRFKIRVKADISSEQREIVAIRGEGAADAAAAAGVETVAAWWRDGSAVDAPAGTAVGRAGDAADLLSARVQAAWPAMGAEIVPGETIPAETGVASVAVSFTKGCYPGQELVERMDSRGAAPPRLLRTVTVPEGAQPGDALVRDGAEIGTITSVAGTTALATVKRAAADTL